MQKGKNKMNDFPIQGCSTEADGQNDKLILGTESSPKKYNGVKKSDDYDAPSIKKTFELSESITNNVKRSKRPRGLTNLGNTCFYNSVLQCLAQTPFIRKLLFDISESGKPMTIKLDNEDIIVHQEKWSSLTENLYTTLQEITNEQDSTFTPSALLESLRKKCKMFIGYGQHDSHEVLRHLLDSVRDDDLKRYKRTIIHHYSLSMKVEPSEVDEKNTAIIKELGKKLQDYVVLHPDHVFKGELLSVIQCQNCGYKSEVTESFLDLSLPITVDKTHQLCFPRKEDNDVFSQYKHQTKEECKLALKQGKLNKQFNNKIQDTLAVNYDKGIENNTEIETNEIEMSVWKNENKENSESGYGSEKQPSNNTSPSQSITEFTTFMNNTPLADSDRQLDATQLYFPELLSVLSASPSNSPSSPQGSLLDSVHGNVSPDSMDAWTDSANENLECNSPTQNVINNRGYGLFEEDVEDEEEGEFSQQCPQATLQFQPNYKDNECSVLTCLSQFTASEVLSDDNKISCKRCTEQPKKKANVEKTIYFQSTIQMLISSPPAILILHLKRFQMCNSITRKITTNVSFQWILDIAPYCSVKCQDKLSPGQNRILYSLYGVVEHNGFLHSGHYLSYVKVRDSVKDDSYRYSFLEGSKTKPPKVIDGNDDPSHLAPSGTWYCVSDSMVRQVTPTVVQSCQAYLLFYERIL
ncbi:ubiquitin carboxyl-terminal hydrolase 16-like [Acyrthosiphon pisum]|uniref:ubiquitinyl hydrolase 1 n=1 Tax=Acyrthosiphon pisum TaxID=7029 RepID=A0A8R2FBW7_ACYPI|nr:ubiquitin carboxyl-terminal hydrolase 16-like [Acyrthosiphon pisum]|eukprot:XP_008185652.1 PREDICTED: ubiquitin carboxyl-terminal hydrolase 16-like [Acyrthosiphon pisum]